MSRATPIDRWFSSCGLADLPGGWTKPTFGQLVTASRYGISGDTGDLGPYPILKMNNVIDGQVDLA